MGRKTAITRLVATRCLDTAGSAPSTSGCIGNQSGDSEQYGEKPKEDYPKDIAFRAIVKDDAAALEEVLASVPVDEWCNWKNKGRQSLASMAEHLNGLSSSCYTLLAGKLGLPLEMSGEDNR